MIKVIAFDLFGTVFDMGGVPREHVINYVKHLKKPEWSPLILPDVWDDLPAFPDSKGGINWLRENYTVVTCTNAPLATQIQLCKKADITFDALIPLELSRSFKTQPEAYMSVCAACKIEPHEMMMVTANEDFGDLTASNKLGMNPVFIRHDSKVTDIMHLGELMQNPDKVDLTKVVYEIY